MSTSPSFSVIIPARNSALTIGALVKSALSQTPPPREVLVIDGSSSDRTRDVSERAGARVIGYDCTGDMRGYARNLGAQSSEGDVLLFLDSDMELTEGVLAEAEALISSGGDAVVFPEKTIGRGLLGRTRSWERRLVEAYDFLCFSRAIRKGIILQLGGFDERILGFEDLDLQASLIESGCRILRAHSPIIHHEEDQTMASYLRKRRYYQRTSYIYRIKHPQLSKTVFSPLLRLRIYCHGVKSVEDVLCASVALGLRASESF